MRGPGRDDGITLVETLVAMTIVATLTALVLTSVISVSRGALRTQNTSDTATEVRRAFTMLDRQVRYADAVNEPGTTGAGTAGARHWVEFRVVSDTAGAPRECTQWQYVTATGALRTRTWSEGALASTGVWTTVMVSAGGAGQGQPFTRVGTTADLTRQKLAVDLRDTRRTAGSSDLRTTFVARNSSSRSPATVCDPVDRRS